MVQISNDIKNQISDVFKELIKENSFEKITIKMITAQVGIHRPKFYTYFQDKYEIIEYILEMELITPLKSLMELEMTESSIDLTFNYFQQNSGFYQTLLDLQGPNSFQDILKRKIQEVYLGGIENYHLKDKSILSIISIEELTSIYSKQVVMLIEAFIKHSFDEGYTVEDAKEVYLFITRNSIFDLLEESDQ